MANEKNLSTVRRGHVENYILTSLSVNSYGFPEQLFNLRCPDFFQDDTNFSHGASKFENVPDLI